MIKHLNYLIIHFQLYANTCCYKLKKSLLYYLSKQTRIFNFQLNIAIFYYCTDYKKENATKQPYSLNVRLELKSDITNEIFQKFCSLLTKTNFF